MKTIRTLIVIFSSSFLLFGLSSCAKYLEELPQNKLKPSTTADYEQLLNRAYISNQIMPYLDILSDDVELIASNHVMDGADNGDSYLSAYMWQNHHEFSMPQGDIAFSTLYSSIFYTNVVIENIDQAIGVELNAENVLRDKNRIKGEALVLRAYCYFYLINLYGLPYNPATAASDQGVPINLATAAEDKAYTRASVAQVYAQILNDLKAGVALLETQQAAPNTKVKFNKLSSNALLARVYLYMHNWEEAIKTANQVLSANTVLFNLQPAGNVLNETNNASTIWNGTTLIGRDYLSKDNDNVLFVNGINELLPALTYWPFVTTFSVNRELAATYEPNDVRRWYFMYTYTRNTYAGIRTKLSYAKNRFVSQPINPRPTSGYSRVIRTEEMQLIVAEAAAQKNDVAMAVAALNTLRRLKFKANTYVDLKSSNFDKASMLDFVALERRRELCFEGHRWFDLRRTTRPAQNRIGYENQQAQLKKDDPRYTLQIPRKELSVNPSIGEIPR